MVFVVLLPLLLGVIVLLAIAVGLFVFRRSGGSGQGYPACGSCGYDVTGTLKTNVDRCPECGNSLAQVGVRPPGRAGGTSNTPLLVMGVVAVVVILGCGGLFATMFYARAGARQAPIIAQPTQPAASAGQTPAPTADQPPAESSGAVER